MATEEIDPRFTDLDAWPLASAVEAMWDGQMSATAAVRQALPAITAAAAAAADVLGQAGRLIYAGAGTSGRVAVQDGAELPPTFNWPPERIVFVLAGGPGSLTASVEGAEDDAADGIRQINDADAGPGDVLIAVAASGSTPFTVAATRTAANRGVTTIGIANNANTPLLAAARFPILIPTGSELIAGSTRMKAGTAQKVVLNLISSAIMLRLGRVYGGMMVNMRVANTKLRHRAIDMVARIAGCDPEQAAAALQETRGDIKMATLVVSGFSLDDAAAMLERAGGNLRTALSQLGAEGL